MSTFPGRLFGPGLPGGGGEAAARWFGGRLEITAGGRVFSASVERVEAAGFNDGQLRMAFRHAADGGEAEFAFFVDQPEARAAFAAGAPPGITAQLGGVTRAVRGSRRRLRVGWLVLGLVLSLPFLALAAFLARSDAIAAWAVARIPVEQEKALGDMVLAQTRAQMTLADSGPMAETVRHIGERLTPGTRLQYRWFVADAPEINAFAAPGGVVVVNSGLIRAAETPEELAGVLAHEVAHAELRHGMRSMVKRLGLRALLSAALGDVSSGLEAAVGDLTELRFSRDAEREADADGLKRLLAARIDPQGMVRFFERLEKEGSASVPALLSTHPVTGERLEALRRELERVKVDVTPIAVDWDGVKSAL
jgi:Zn-dependent protease with chaperone function